VNTSNSKTHDNKKKETENKKNKTNDNKTTSLKTIHTRSNILRLLLPFPDIIEAPLDH
jgi:hypothetical protein